MSETRVLSNTSEPTRLTSAVESRQREVPSPLRVSRHFPTSERRIDSNAERHSRSASSSSLRSRTKHRDYSVHHHHHHPSSNEHRRSRSLVRSSQASCYDIVTSTPPQTYHHNHHTPSDRSIRAIHVRRDRSTLFFSGDLSNTSVDYDEDNTTGVDCYYFRSSHLSYSSERSPLLLNHNHSSDSRIDRIELSDIRTDNMSIQQQRQINNHQKVSPYRTFGSDTTTTNVGSQSAAAVSSLSSQNTGGSMTGDSPIQRVWDSFSQSMRNLNPPAGSLRASTLTVVTGMVGGGTLTLSLAIKKSGMIFGLFYIVAIGMLSGYSALVLVFCAERNNCPSFRSLALDLYGPSTAKGIQFMLLLMLWSASVSYMTLVKTLLTDAMHISFGSAFWDSEALLLVFCVCVIVMPLALMRKVSALRYASMAGLAALSFTVCVVIGLYFTWCDGVKCHTEDGHKDCEEKRRCLLGSLTHLSYVNDDWIGHPYSIAVILGGFAAHPTVLPIYFEMQRRSSVRMRRCLIYGFIFTILMYTLIAYFGYFTFPDNVEANLLSSDYRHNPIMLVSATFLCLYVISVCPLFAHAFRKSLSELLLEGKQPKNNGNNIENKRRRMKKSHRNGKENNNGGITEEFKDVVDDPASHFAFVPTLTPRTRNVFDRAALREAENRQAQYHQREQRQSQKRLRNHSKKKKSKDDDDGNDDGRDDDHRRRKTSGIQVVHHSNMNEPLMNSLMNEGGSMSVNDNNSSNQVSLDSANFSFVGVDAENGKAFGGINHIRKMDGRSHMNNNVDLSPSSSSVSSHSSFDDDNDTLQFNDDPMLKDDMMDDDDLNLDHHSPNELPIITHTVVTVAFIASAMGVALVASNIGVVNSIIGSTTLPVCCFFFPAAVSWRTEEATSTMRTVTTITSLVVLINSLLTLYTTFA